MISTSAGLQPDAKKFLSRYVAENVPDTVKQLQDGEDGRWPFPGEEAMRGKESMTFADAYKKGTVVL